MEPQYLTIYDMAPGSKVGDYTIVGPNRQGGFSTAYEATDEKGERCELQFFPAGLFEEDGQAANFRTRLTPWTEIESPAVVRVRDLVELDNAGLVLVTDYPDGASLRELLNRDKRLEPTRVADFGRQLLAGLEKIHEKGLSHGDIKPYTIHVDEADGKDRAYLVDGGVTPGLWTAKELSGKTALIGTPYYAPMEQFGGDAPDVRSDIYNLATVLYESITGVVPWRGKSFLEVFQAKLEEPPPMAERAAGVEVSQELEAAIRKGCQPDRHKRFDSAKEFREALG